MLHDRSNHSNTHMVNTINKYSITLTTYNRRLILKHKKRKHSILTAAGILFVSCTFYQSTNAPNALVCVNHESMPTYESRESMPTYESRESMPTCESHGSMPTCVSTVSLCPRVCQL